ncbi:MAG TPA: hypothetical protein VK140_09260 [Ktedonobacteraceae bacterium]|nr:hypothetical protein [Ktedonobacteraceae bacterium]
MPIRTNFRRKRGSRRGGSGGEGWRGRLRRPRPDDVSHPTPGRRKRPHPTPPNPRPYGITPPLVKLVRVGEDKPSPCGWDTPHPQQITPVTLVTPVTVSHPDN